MTIITVARKPLGVPTVAENVLKWGTGALHIDQCRQGFDQEEPPSHKGKGRLKR